MKVTRTPESGHATTDSEITSLQRLPHYFVHKNVVFRCFELTSIIFSVIIFKVLMKISNEKLFFSKTYFLYMRPA
jgi:hypothetical protein